MPPTATICLTPAARFTDIFSALFIKEKNKLHLIGVSSLSLLAAGLANAHVSVTSGTAYAGSYYQVDLAVPHGCDGADTESIEVEIPASLSGVRPVFAFTGDSSAVSIEKDGSGAVTKLTYTRSNDAGEDSNAYSISFRGKLADVPFTTLYFPTTQTCFGGAVSAWVGTGGHDHHGSSAESSELPAPSMMVYPTRHPGWNEYTAQDHLHDMSIFNDAEIVWKGSAAYSPNTATMEMIEADENSSVLEQIHPDESFWVKY